MIFLFVHASLFVATPVCAEIPSCLTCPNLQHYVGHMLASLVVLGAVQAPTRCLNEMACTSEIDIIAWGVVYRIAQ